MFKWICLAVAVVFLVVLAWMINDMRLEVRRSIQMAQATGQTVNEHLPTIVEKSRKATDTVAEHLPEIVEKTRTSTQTLAEVAEDIRQVKELLGVDKARDKNLVAYADSLLDSIEASGGTVGLKKSFGRSELKDGLPAKEWVVSARKEALVLTVLVRSKQELVTRLTKNKFGSPWYIQIGEKDPMPLLDWLKANHAGSQEF